MGFDIEPFGDPEAFEFQDENGVWHPGVKDVGINTILWWIPDAGVPADMQPWQDGIVLALRSWAAPPVSLCGSFTNAQMYEWWDDPSLVRTSTIEPGRFEVSHSMVVYLPDGPVWPPFFLVPMRWSGEWGIRFRFRYARAELAG
jgi:hypothetical protein